MTRPALALRRLPCHRHPSERGYSRSNRNPLWIPRTSFRPPCRKFDPRIPSASSASGPSMQKRRYCYYYYYCCPEPSRRGPLVRRQLLFSHRETLWGGVTSCFMLFLWKLRVKADSSTAQSQPCTDVTLLRQQR